MLELLKNLFGSTNQQQLREAIQRGALLVDVRTPSEFLSGSVKGAINVPLDRLSNQLSRFKGMETIIVFCRSGNRSAQAKHSLEQLGFYNILNGGTVQNVNSALHNN